MHKEIESAINQQINHEFNAAYAYLGMSSYFDDVNLSGFSSWCKAQYEEEVVHAMRLYDYLQDRGGKVLLGAISAPKSDYSSTKQVFTTALSLEEQNTAAINNLYMLANTVNDHATISHLQWFIDEQVEEEKSINDIIALIEMAGTDINAIFYLNDKLGQRDTVESV